LILIKVISPLGKELVLQDQMIQLLGNNKIAPRIAGIGLLQAVLNLTK